MKIIRRTALLAMAAVMAVSACVSCADDSAIGRIRKNGGLKVGYCSCSEGEDAPFLIGDGSEGLTGEPAANIAKSFHTDVLFSRLATTEAYDKLISGEVDCLWNCRPPEKQYVSSVRTIETGLHYRQVIMTTQKSKISRLADVKGKKLAVVSGSDAQTELHNASVMESSLKEIVVCDSIQQVLEALLSGKVHCAAVDEPQAMYAAANMDENSDSFKYVETPIAECSLTIVTRADNADLCARIAEKYVAFSRDGGIKNLCEKYNLTELLKSSLADNPAEAST